MIFHSCVNMKLKKKTQIKIHRYHITEVKIRNKKVIFKLYQTTYNLSTIKNYFTSRSAHSLYSYLRLYQNRFLKW